MSSEATVTAIASQDNKSGRLFAVIFDLILLIGGSYAAVQLIQDLSIVKSGTAAPYILLGATLLIALGFEVAGTMAANGSGLQWGTVRSLLMAWVLTLPVSILLAGSLFVVFRHIF